MRWILAIALLALASAASAGGRRPLLYDPVSLNIGVNCQWQAGCMAQQRAAMVRSLTYVSDHKPPKSHIQLCNRNASRGGVRTDWVGYDHCIRNRSLKHRR